MTTTTLLGAPAHQSSELRARLLPRWSFLAIAAGAVLVAVLLAAVTPISGTAGTVVVAALLYLVGQTAVSFAVEGRRHAVDRFATTVVVTCFLLALLPLGAVLATVVAKGGALIDGTFLTHSLRNVGNEAGGGVYHGIVGTLEQAAITSLISIPVAVLVAIYLVEYGKGAFARVVTFFVDVMTGIPSIVAGLFAFALFSLITGNPGYRSGFGGSVALSLLMIPIVVRASEEMLKLVPNELREASYALGVPRWLTILKVVLPTALAGIVTGVTLAIARVIGETAPLLLVAGYTTSMNYDLFNGPMVTLPVFSYTQYAQPGVDPTPSLDRAWTAALVLILLVLLLNLVARLIARFFSPKLPA